MVDGYQLTVYGEEEESLNRELLIVNRQPLFTF